MIFKFKIKKGILVSPHLDAKLLGFIKDHMNRDAEFYADVDRDGDAHPCELYELWLKKEWLTPIKEKTEAEEYTERFIEKAAKTHPRMVTIDYEVKKAHEAGQEFATKKTHEIYKPLLDTCKKVKFSLELYKNFPPTFIISIIDEYEKLNR